MTTKSTQIKKMISHHSSPFPACFRPPISKPALDPPHAPPPTTSTTTTTTTTTPNLTTNLYQTHLGLFSITWSRSFLARTLHIHLHSTSASSPSTSSPSFHLTLKPFAFWSKRGSKIISQEGLVEILWDFSNARFGLGPEPESGYYIALISNGATVLLTGDFVKGFQTRVKHRKLGYSYEQDLVVRREHVCGTRFYSTRATIGGKLRDILIEVNSKTVEDDLRLVIRFDNKRVVQVKHLKWKFRGSERFEVDGHQVQFSWDVCNWLFVDGCGGGDEGYALFTFRFELEKKMTECKERVGRSWDGSSSSERVLTWSQDSGLSYERKKMKKKLLVKTSSFSSSSLSSASSCGSSSIMEWESVEENELKAPTGFSLLVYAWKN